MKLSRICAALLLLVFLSACGEGDEELSTNVEDMDVTDGTISVGEGTVVRVDFSFSNGPVFNDGENVVITVRLPAELRYRSGTAEIDGVFDDEEVGPQFTPCPATGETYMVFDLDNFDLDDADAPSGSADARLNFTVDAVAESGSAVMEARSDANSSVFACGSSFAAEQSTAVRIVG